MQFSAPSISADEFARWRDGAREYRLLDVREPWELEICHFAEALAIPLHQLPERLAEIPEEATLVVVCHHGVRSLHAVNWLRGNGRPAAINLDGGIDDWARRIDKTMGVY